MPQTLEFDKNELVVLPGAFPPYLDSTLMIRAMTIYNGDHVLEVGTGCGIIAIAAAQRAASVVATDINPAAVESVRLNAERFGLSDRLSVVEADLFPAHRAERFDVVIFNPPYTDHPAADVIERSVWDPGHETVRRFFSAVADVLQPEGRIYLGWADFADLEFVEQLIVEHGGRFRRIDQAHDDVSLFVVYEVTLLTT